MNAHNRPTLTQETYQRDGVWYTLAVIDSTSTWERKATQEEIDAAKAEAKKVKK